MSIEIALYDNEKDTLPKPRTLTPEQLATLLTSHQRTFCSPCAGHKCRAKFGPAWSPAVLKGPRHKSNVVAVTALVFDIDDQHEDAVAEVLERLRSAGLGFVVHSSHSYAPPERARIRVVIQVSRQMTPDEYDRIRAAAIRAYQIPADPQTKDASRLYFLPSAPVDGPEPFAANVPGAELNVDEWIERAAKMPPPAAPAPVVAPPPAPVPAPVNDTVPVDPVVRALRATGNSDSNALMRKVLAGESFAPHGQHDLTLLRIASICAYGVPLDTPEELLVQLCWSSFAATWEDGPEDCARAFTEKLRRDRAKRAQEDKRRAAFAERLAATARRNAARLLQGVAADEPPDSPGEPYSEAQLSYWAQRMRCASPDDLVWVVQRDRGFYVLINGRYFFRTAAELANSIPHDFSRAPFPLRVPKDKDADRLITVQELVQWHGAVAFDVCASMSLSASYFDRATGIFHEAVCPLRPIVPRFDQEIHDWLLKLGGPRLVDWVATVAMLERPTAALYLHGPKSSGKTLLPTGLARLWREGPPSSLANVLGNFNDTLTGCPMILADESVPERRNITEDLRNLISVNQRTLNRKFQPSVQLHGAVRLVIAANNPNLLQTRQDMTIADLEAVSEKFFYAEINDAASEHLRRLGGFAYIHPRWVEGDGLAAHALWLAQHHKVEHGSRLLVEGERKKFHDAIAVGSGVTGGVGEFLVRFVAGVPGFRKEIPGILVGEGEVWVNAPALIVKDDWERLVPSMDVQPLRRVSSSLAVLAHSDETIRVRTGAGHLRFYRMRVDRLVSLAEALQAGDVDQIVARINAPNATIAEAMRSRGWSPKAFTKAS